KQAQERGVVRGILLHQGESNTGDNTWASQVKKIYERLLSDLGLKAAEVPLLAGEVAPGGSSKGANTMIDALPKTIATSYVVSAQGLNTTTADGQNVHFDAPSYRTLGKRYAQTMMPLLRKQISSVAPAAKASGALSDRGAQVYDLHGALVARIGAGDDLQAGWDRTRSRLPQGLFWIRSAQGTVQVLNDR
ncbi:MAG TPA: sialate O-acetylesterase, partial [Fibrobacteria bacterium]|nr:sialate O-acetylesterase [Fibrobacteria bacterium]